MTRSAFLFLFIIGISSCKKYFDPKYTYTQPVMDFKVAGQSIEADSAIALIDSMHLDTSKIYTYFTTINTFNTNNFLIKMRLQGRFQGNYTIENYTSLFYKNPNNGNVYAAQSGKIVISEWDKSAKKISGYFYATVVDSTGNSIQIESGKFNAIPIK